VQRCFDDPLTPTQSSLTPNQVLIYDTTLRDGSQAPYVSLSLADKLSILQHLLRNDIDFIEGGENGRGAERSDELR